MLLLYASCDSMFLKCILRNNINAKVLYVTSENFTNQLINALKANTPEQFYAISKGETSEQIWNTTAAGLTAIQFKYPEKQNEINKFYYI